MYKKFNLREDILVTILSYTLEGRNKAHIKVENMVEESSSVALRSHEMLVILDHKSDIFRQIIPHARNCLRAIESREQKAKKT